MTETWIVGLVTNLLDDSHRDHFGKACTQIPDMFKIARSAT